MSLSHSLHQEERSQPPQGHNALASRFLAMMQEYADVFWWLAPDSWMQEVSSSWHTFTGQQERECLGRGWLDALHPADQRQFDNTLHHTLTSGQTAEMECHLRRDDGTYRLIHLRMIPVRLPDGTIGEVLVCGTDLTRQELAGKMSDAQRQLAGKASGVGMWDWDLRTDQVVWTDQMKALFGLSPDTPISAERFLEAVHPEDRQRVARLHTHMREKAQDSQGEYRVIWPDGSVHWLSSRARGTADASGTPLHIVGVTIEITEQKRAEERLTALLDTLADAFFQVDLGWHLTYVNRQAERSAGISVSREEVLGRSLWEVAPELVDTPIERQLRNAMATRQRVNFDAVGPRGGRWIEVQVRPVPDGLSISFHDIDERKQAEEGLQEAHQRITDILESITDAFSHVDTEWRYTYVNRGLEKLMGKKREEIVGRSLWEMVPEVLATPFEDAYRQAMATQQTRHVEGFHPTFQRWLEISLYPAPDGLSFYLHDITERKQAEEAVRESEARFRGLVESNIIGITIADLDGQIYEANDAFLHLVGYTRDDLAAGQLWWTAMTAPEYQEREAQAMGEELATGKFHPFEKEYVRKDGTRVPVLIGGTLFRREGTWPLIISFIVDQTARKEIERQKDLFLGMTGHELKTPLAALRGTLQLIQRRMKRVTTTADRLSPALHAFFDGLTRSVADSVRQIDVQARLINDLLDVSRITSNTLKLSLQPCELRSIVRQTVEDLRVTAPGRSLVLEVPEHTAVPVLADRDRISQVVTNYVTNAIRYSPASQPVYIGLTTEKDLARVWVRDWGPGLSVEAQQDIWQRFHQVKDIPVQSGSGKGLGLGLYICQTLIAQHQGEVGVESRPGEGSRFWFTLPMVR